MSFCSSAKTFPHRDGTLQEFMNHPTDYLHKFVLTSLPSSPSFLQKTHLPADLPHPPLPSQNALYPNLRTRLPRRTALGRHPSHPTSQRSPARLLRPHPRMRCRRAPLRRCRSSYGCYEDRGHRYRSGQVGLREEFRVGGSDGCAAEGEEGVWVREFGGGEGAEGGVGEGVGRGRVRYGV